MDLFTPEEIRLIGDADFFLAKARIMAKVRQALDALHAGLREDAAGISLLSPPGFDAKKFQMVKGEHLEACPYQYLDYPKHFEGDDKFTFRSLFWWGHHVVFALILEGEGLLRYKQNLINRFHQVAGKDLFLSLAPSLWEWKHGDGYTLPLLHDRKSQVSAVLAQRPSFKIARFIPCDDPLIQTGQLVQAGRDTFKSLLPIITP